MLPAGKPYRKPCFAPAPDLTPAPALAYIATHKINAAIFFAAIFLVYVARIFFNFVSTKSGRQGKRLGYFTNLLFLMNRANDSDYFTLTNLGAGGCSTAALNSDLDSVVASSGAAKMCFLLS
jgi:hypothetical protein